MGWEAITTIFVSVLTAVIIPAIGWVVGNIVKLSTAMSVLSDKLKTHAIGNEKDHTVMWQEHRRAAKRLARHQKKIVQHDNKLKNDDE